MAFGTLKINAVIGTPKNAYDKNVYINCAEFEAALNAITEDDVTVEVNTPGGSVVQANQMSIALQRSGKNITMRIGALAASMGYFVCVPFRIVASAASIIMLHSVQLQASGSPEDLQAEAEAGIVFRGSIAVNLAKRTGLTEAEVTAKYLTGGDHYFTAQQALDLKLIDAIEEYDVEALNIDVTAIGFDGLVTAFNAAHQQAETTSILDKVMALVDTKLSALFKKKAVNAVMLSDQDEWNLYYILSDLRALVNSAECMEDCSTTPEVITPAKAIVAQCSKWIIELTTLLYADEVLEPTEMEARLKEITGKVADKRNTNITALAITAAKDFVAAELKAKDDAIALVNTQLAALQTENTALKAQPATGATRVKAPKTDSTITGEIEVEEKYETSFDREKREARAKISL